MKEEGTNKGKKVIVIGDVHGRSVWRDIIAMYPDTKHVFLGDYNDPLEWRIKDADVLSNFTDIIRYKHSRPEDVVLLLGNHDIHYFCEDVPICSRFNMGLAVELMTLFIKHEECFQYAYQLDDLLFTHAGISEEWFTSCFCGNRYCDVATQLNNATGVGLQSLYACGKKRGGTAEYGGIFWADIDELESPLSDYVQIVGHNRVMKVEQQWKRSCPGTGILYCDCLLHGGYLEIDLDLQGRERFIPHCL